MRNRQTQRLSQYYIYTWLVSKLYIFQNYKTLTIIYVRTYGATNGKSNIHRIYYMHIPIYSCCPNLCTIAEWVFRVLWTVDSLVDKHNFNLNISSTNGVEYSSCKIYIYSFIEHIDIAHTVTSDNWRPTRLWIKLTCGAAGIMNIRSKYCKIAAHSRRYSMLLLTAMTFCILFKLNYIYISISNILEDRW